MAAIAIRADLPVLHCDRDFEAIARCVPLRVVAT
jgi:predicted nucleic acid-binding protein